MDNLLHSLLSFLLPTQQQRDIAVDAIYEITPTFLFTIAVVAICELASYQTVRALRKTKEGAALHTAGIIATLFNLFLIGIPVHVVARLIMPAGEERRNSAWESLGRIAVFVLLQNILYYLAHMTMHSHPALYSIHKFHHRYNVNITPSSANAVSVAEFLFAYIIPPAIILLLVQPSKMENTIAMNIISHCSTLIHTPCLEEWCARNLPAWWVGTDDHFEHHRRLTKNYAAPCLHLDHLLGQQKAVVSEEEDVQKRN